CAFAARTDQTAHQREAAMTTSLRVVALLLLLAATARPVCADVEIVTDPAASPRVKYGAAKLGDAIRSAGVGAGKVILSTRTAAPESFAINTSPDATIRITGGDDSGALYGCLELADRVRQTKALPANLTFADAPVMRLR